MTIDALDESDDLPLGHGFMLWQITNGWQRAVRAALVPCDLTYVQVVLLAGLEDRLSKGESVNQAGLAHALGADVMMTSQVLRVLEAQGLVRRDRNPQDTRARTLLLTDEGKARLNQALPLVKAADDGFFEALGRKEDRFIKSMRKLWRKRRLFGMHGHDCAADDPNYDQGQRTMDPLARRRQLMESARLANRSNNVVIPPQPIPPQGPSRRRPKRAPTPV